ncbi:DUF6090 family protein [Marinigracilibium pacificum]|uniref:Uncharacterized protein n=1 Tax=Marinigracilibium pacificum TaxID=2729599 RepID=A0A848J261_9BACT|nr:DUF6090 family protein [Marinigracilibium pacificum]NMM50677.1 hypothetical protein [Marinigracilibium pacificum]
MKFLRKIREKLLSENKFTKYLIYAVGEIFLVVIGILIALGINNWKENWKDSAMEINILKEISENLGNDLLSLENDVRLNKMSIKNIQAIEESLDSNQQLTDTLLMRFGRITFNPTYTLKSSGYKHLSSIGFQIIKVDSIRQSITNLYETQYSFLKEREETAEKLTYEYLNTQLQGYFKEIKFDSSRNKLSPTRIYHPKNFETLKSDDDFQRLLDYSKEIKYGNLYELNIALEEITLTKRMIDKYLENRSN